MRVTIIMLDINLRTIDCKPAFIISRLSHCQPIITKEGKIKMMEMGPGGRDEEFVLLSSGFFGPLLILREYLLQYIENSGFMPSRAPLDGP